MYTVNSCIVIGMKNGKDLYEVEITVDTESDLPNPVPENWAAGSVAVVAEKHIRKILTNAGVWV